jgi:hypothetical protein
MMKKRIFTHTRQIFLCLLLTALSIISILLSPAFTGAQSSSVNEGTEWLLSNQDPDGSWSEESRTFPDTFAALETLLYLNISDDQLNLAVDWLRNLNVYNTDDLSRKIFLLSMAGDDTSSELAALLDLQNSDNGWGAEQDFSSDVIDTTLILRTLYETGYSDPETISYALSYLIDSQNINGGFGFCPGDDSNVFMTAMVLKTFNSYGGTFDLRDEINDMAAYLLTKQNTDGGFGSNSSTVYETALVIIGLIYSGQGSALPVQNTLVYLYAKQLPNGSWNDDPYSTALALRALHIAASDEPPVTTGTVTGKVVNSSTEQPLNGVPVVVQNNSDIAGVTNITGDFTLADVPEGSLTIKISMQGYVTATTTLDIVSGTINNLGTIPLSPNPTAGIIKGTVTDTASGQPLEGVTIMVTGSFNSSAITDADGGFIFTGVTPGSVTVTADKAGYYLVSGTGTVVAEGTLFFNPQMSTTPPAISTGSLTGTVIDGSTNAAVQGAIITLESGESTVTDLQGGFIIGPDISRYYIRPANRAFNTLSAIIHD